MTMVRSYASLSSWRCGAAANTNSAALSNAKQVEFQLEVTLLASTSRLGN